MISKEFNTKPKPMMASEEINSYIRKHNEFPPPEKLIKAPTTWIPVKPENPSKLTLHYFDNGVWYPTINVRFVDWPEAFQDAVK